MDKPYSPAADRNKDFILEVLKQYITTEGRLIEIGSGSGQHAVHMAKSLPDVQWVTTDQPEYHEGINAWVEEAKLSNLHGPKKLTIGTDDFPDKKPFNFAYSANTLHIMSWKECKTLFKLLGKRLREGGLVFFYGPFNYDGKFTSDSNRDFDQMLKSRDSKSGIRNYEDVLAAMNKAGFKILSDVEMPANNRTLIFLKLDTF